MTACKSLLFASVLCAAATAHAQAPASTAAATAQFDRGRQLLKAGKLAEACAAFEQSQKLEASFGTLYNLANCRAQTGKLASAWVAYRELAQRDTNARRRGEAARRAQALEPRLPRLLIKVAAPPPGMTITMNGNDVTSLVGVESPVDLGSYDISATAPSFHSHQVHTEVIAEATTVTVTLELERAAIAAPAPRPPAVPAPATHAIARPLTDDPPRSHRKTYAVIAGGTGLALVATGLVFGSLARSKWSDAKQLCGSDLVCEPAQGAEGTRLSGAAHRDGNIATGLIIGGAAALGLGTYLWLSAPSHAERTALRLVPSATPTDVGLAVTGGF